MPISVAIYARHSTDKQSHSTEDQIACCKDHCRNAGYEIVQVFQDEAISGASIINRPGISNLIDEAVAGYFDRVISEDLSRISRDQCDIANLYRKLQYLGIELETLEEGEINELHIGLKGTMNALYLKDLAHKTRRGMIAAVLKGSIPGGRAYGYDVVHKLDEKQELVRGIRKINTDQAETVNLIFDQYARGATLAQICDSLNHQCIPAPKGGSWGNSSLIGQAARRTGLLRQTLYKGVVTFNRMMYRKNPETGLRQSFMRPESEWIQVPVPELAIMSDDTFDHVQDMIEQRSYLRNQKRRLNQVLDQTDKPKIIEKRERQIRSRQAKPRRKQRQVNLYLFSGKLWCLEHNRPISVVRKKLYSCSVKPCIHRNLKHDSLMRLALLAIKQNDITKIKAAIKEQRQRSYDLKVKITAKESELETARQSLRNIYDALANRRTVPEATQYLDEREAAILKIKYDLDKLNKQYAPIAHIEDNEAKAILNALNKTIAPLYTTPNDQKIIPEIFPWFNRFTITNNQGIAVEYNWFKLFLDLR